MTISWITYQACQLNAPDGPWHFCKVYGGGKSIYPIGLCRENNQPGRKQCMHRNEAEAWECFSKWQDEQIKLGLIPLEDQIKLIDKNEKE